MASISLRHINKTYSGGVTAIPDFNLEIQDKEFIILVGPSGCGKSTTLRMIAGLEDITSGELYIGDKLVNDVAPKDRDIAMVFQNYALYPHMSVYKNMAFGLELRKVPKDVIRQKVEEAAKILDIEHILDRKPKALSGGQQQRVALGRAMVRDPAVFLLDEPLSNLDAKLRNTMRSSQSNTLLYGQAGIPQGFSLWLCERPFQSSWNWKTPSSLPQFPPDSFVPPAADRRLPAFSAEDRLLEKALLPCQRLGSGGIC